jgi:hypothetical protein
MGEYSAAIAATELVPIQNEIAITSLAKDCIAAPLMVEYFHLLTEHDCMALAREYPLSKGFAGYGAEIRNSAPELWSNNSNGLPWCGN